MSPPTKTHDKSFASLGGRACHSQPIHKTNLLRCWGGGACPQGKGKEMMGTQSDREGDMVVLRCHKKACNGTDTQHVDWRARWSFGRRGGTLRPIPHVRAAVVSTYSQQRCRCPASLYRWPPLPHCASCTQPAHCAAPSTMLRPESQKQACACPEPGGMYSFC